MEIVTQLETHRRSQPTAIALGTFDGVHIGHRAVIENVLNRPGLVPAVFTFSHAPAGILGKQPAGMLATPAAKQEILEQMGIRLFISPPFLSVRDMEPQTFLRLLSDRFGAKYFSCGYNFRFGREGAGDAAFLKAFGEQNGIAVNICPPVTAEQTPVSSSQIRALIQKGEVLAAAKLLGRRFSFDFPVVHGDGRGRTWDFPTINQRWPSDFVLPKCGVYAASVAIDGKSYKGISNIGVHPTVGAGEVACETFIFGFSGDLYNRRITVSLVDFIRPEKRFANTDELRQAIAADVQTVQNMDF